MQPYSLRRSRKHEQDFQRFVNNTHAPTHRRGAPVRAFEKCAHKKMKSESGGGTFVSLVHLETHVEVHVAAEKNAAPFSAHLERNAGPPISLSNHVLAAAQRCVSFFEQNYCL